MTGIIHYGAGNVFSVLKSVERAGCNAKIIYAPAELKDVGNIILPGVGAFDDGITAMRESGMESQLKEEIKKGKYLLGLCLGLQLFFEKSEEGNLPGLNLFPGSVPRFPENLSCPVPHMGWNQVNFKKQSVLFRDIPDSSYFYFAHSYYVVPEDKNIVAGTTGYEIEFTSVIEKDNVIGFQFHPEKSSVSGQRLLSNFLNLK